jgi:cyclic pyranopterin phosphate synthase
MPREVFGPEFEFLRRAEILSFEEIRRLVAVMMPLGVRKVRLTGGEPLLRKDLAVLVGRLAALEGLELALTTNGILLGRHAHELAAAGLDRITVSLDSLDDATFRSMNDVDVPVSQVLDGIKAAAAAGLNPVKVNVVVVRGVNDEEVVEIARRFKGSGQVVRFIEYMDVGTTNGWKLEQVVSGSEILARLRAEMELEAVAPAYPGEVARRWRHVDGGGEIGLITSVSQPFCGDCTRARLSAEGRLFSCLFASEGLDVRALLRAGATDGEVRQAIGTTWSARSDRYSELRSAATPDLPKVEMSYIGG